MGFNPGPDMYELERIEQKKKLTRRFISGILIGCFIALFICAALYLVIGFRTGGGSAQIAAGLSGSDCRALRGG